MLQHPAARKVLCENLEREDARTIRAKMRRWYEKDLMFATYVGIERLGDEFRRSIGRVKPSQSVWKKRASKIGIGSLTMS